MRFCSRGRSAVVPRTRPRRPFAHPGRRGRRRLRLPLHPLLPQPAHLFVRDHLAPLSGPDGRVLSCSDSTGNSSCRPLAEVIVVDHEVSERTLRDALNEVHGVSPQRYLLLRRIYEAHRALREGDRAGSVTDVALRFSFWELGRFAGHYRAAFGEPPSATLRAHRGGVAPVR